MRLKRPLHILLMIPFHGYYCKRTKESDPVTQDEKFMKAAIAQARKAEALDEVPIGCVIVQDGRIIARGYNRRNTDHNTLSHAELTAIKKASKKLCKIRQRKQWRKNILQNILQMQKVLE